jgi:purine nucleosidase/pyrimidine-specific ribonucleoside hydrolase
MTGTVFVGDPGIDDAIAWAVAAAHPGCRVEAVVAGMGNVDARTAWRNAVGLVDLLGWQVPVGMGAASALDGGRPPRADDPIHGHDGLAGCSDRLAAPVGGPVDGLALVRGSIVATGPLTDVARAVRAGQPVDRVIWMGGSLDGGGNVTPVAEFNAWADAAAADEVLTSGLDVTVVPLDITCRVRLSPADLDRWAGGGPAARFCADVGSYRMRDGGAPVHDPVAVIALLEPALFRWEHLDARCATDGDRRGSIVAVAPAGPGARTVRVATAVDAAAVHHRIVELVLGCR